MSLFAFELQDSTNIQMKKHITYEGLREGGSGLQSYFE